MASDGGYVLIHRQILANPVFREPWEAYAFAHLVMLAAWKPTKVRYKEFNMVLERGQVAFSARDLAAAFGQPRMWAQRFLERLQQAGMISRKSGTHARHKMGRMPLVLSICNYDKYQSQSGQDGTHVGTHPEPQNKEINNTLPKRISKDIPKGVPAEALPEWVPQQAWDDWLEMRKAIKKPATAGARKLALKRLTQFRKEGHDPGKVLELATLNCWTGLFAGRHGETQRSGYIGNI